MQTYPGESPPSVALNVLAGVGPRGEEVTHLLADLVSTLPEQMQAAVRVVHGMTAEEMLTGVRAARAQLTDLQNTDRILGAGWQVEGRDTGGIRVQVSLVCAEDAAVGMGASVENLRKENPSDVIRFVVIADGAVETTPFADAGGIRRYIVGSRNAAGEAVNDRSVSGSVAGALLLSVLPGIRLSPDPTDERAVTFGLSAFHGVIGASRRQLGRKLADALLAIHGRPAPEIDQPRFQGKDLSDFAADFAVASLLPRLFDPRLFETGRTDPIPAVPRIREDGTLVVSLDRGAVSLDLVEGQETRWSEQLARYSRTLDMTVAVRWRRQMESAFRSLSESTPRHLTERAKAFLARTVHSHALMRDVLDRIRRNHEGEIQPLPDPTAELEPALRRLNHAVATRPRALDLWLRTALWVLPAAGMAGVLLTLLMNDEREILFGIGISVLLAAAGALGAHLRLEGAWQRILRVRNQAVSIILDRQEAILSENAAGYLGDLIGLLNRESQEVLGFLKRDEEMLAETRKNLEEALARPVEGPVTFEPVLATPEEYEEAFQLLHPNLDQLLEALGNESALSPQAVQVAHNCAFGDRLLNWCDGKIVEGVGMRPISFSAAWEIRRQRRGGATMQQELDALQRRAEPLGWYQPGSETTLRVVPAGVNAEAGASDRAAVETEAEQEIPSPLDIPLFACWKGAHLRAADKAP